MFGPWLSQLGLIITALVHMKKIRSHTVFIRLSTKSTSAANGRRPNAAQCKGNNWADNSQWGSERDKTLVSHAPFIRPGLLTPLSFSLSLSLKVCYFCPIKTNTSRKTYKIALWRSRTNYAKTLIRLCGCACWSESSRDTHVCHIWFVVL